MDIEANIERGEALFSDGLFDEAESVFQRILSVKPDHYEALNNLAVIKHRRGFVEDAEKLLLRSLEVNGKYQEALSNLAEIYESGGRWEEADRVSQKAIPNGSPSSELFSRLDRVRVHQESRSKCDVQGPIEGPSECDSVTPTETGRACMPEARLDCEAPRSPSRPKIALSRSVLMEVIKRACYFPHPEIRRGTLNLSREVFESPDRECNVLISPGARLDLTGDLTIGPWAMIGAGTVIFTHDHLHEGRQMPLLRLQEEKGIKWRSKVIGRDVWLHGCTVLSQVSEIPDGVVVGAGAVLTKNPKPYEIWAGNPASKVGER
ncbi:MAG: tetratricopeptide repeat protein [Proteobacteria bacterium]|nr:tetratricopeptide repeat protein [Pseudomonadota bacterium]